MEVHQLKQQIHSLQQQMDMKRTEIQVMTTTCGCGLYVGVHLYIITINNQDMEDSHTSEVDQHLQQVKLLEDSLNMERLAHQETG